VRSAGCRSGPDQVRSIRPPSTARSIGSRVCTDEAREELRQQLSAALRALGVGNYRAVLDPTWSPGASVLVAGPEDLVRLGTVLWLVARSMVQQVRGHVHDAWDELSAAAGALPRGYSATEGGTVLAQLVAAPRDAAPEDYLWRLVAQLVWREQYELLDLRRRFAPGLMSPRELLIEACIERFFWVSLNPHFWTPPTEEVSLLAAASISADHSRKALCSRGSRLRKFGDPRAGDISQSVWQDIGGYFGLCVAALDELADRSRPVPWCHIDGAGGIPIRRGRLRAWEHAATWRSDLTLGDTPSEMRVWDGSAGPCPSDFPAE
jgi:hypothetical protein